MSNMLSHSYVSFPANNSRAREKRRIESSVLQRVAACYSVLQCAAVCCSVVQCAAVCCSVLQCVEAGCSVM